MSTSITLISVEDSDKSVFITYEANWKNAKFYFNGKLIRSFSSSEELIKGIRFETEELGNVEFKIHTATYSPTLFVDGEIFIEKKPEVRWNQRTTGALIIFGLLVFLNLIMFLFALVNLDDSNSRELSIFLAVTMGFFTVAYLTCFIFLLRGVYFFYFIGLSLFTFTTLYVAYGALQSDRIESLIILAPRLILIGILLIYFKRIIRFMRNSKPNQNSELLDKNF